MTQMENVLNKQFEISHKRCKEIVSIESALWILLQSNANSIQFNPRTPQNPSFIFLFKLNSICYERTNGVDRRKKKQTMAILFRIQFSNDHFKNSSWWFLFMGACGFIEVLKSSLPLRNLNFLWFSAWSACTCEISHWIGSKTTTIMSGWTNRHNFSLKCVSLYCVWF